ncbi:hypothetical protein [Anaerococcus vaginalis]|uniref:hypothetical protein n=1 Tax=Anaerococcus vaginalis TaxID=33037 RepID=UPI00290D779D|nr:hypothetical protein [Anaerococcus vaginalis]MDU5560491.1 hypothetical protein [Anaerococcus vaginalis]
MDTKKLTRLAGLCAICVITRIYLKLIPNVQILSDIILILAINGKLDESLLVNATTMIITSFFLGFGYWVIFQVLDFGILGISNYMIFNKIRVKKTKMNKTIALGLSGFIYGFLITLMQVFLVDGNKFTFFGLYAGSIPFDINHMVGNIVIYIFLIIRLEKYITGEKHFKN